MLLCSLFQVCPWTIASLLPGSLLKMCHLSPSFQICPCNKIPGGWCPCLRRSLLYSSYWLHGWTDFSRPGCKRSRKIRTRHTVDTQAPSKLVLHRSAREGSELAVCCVGSPFSSLFFPSLYHDAPWASCWQLTLLSFFFQGTPYCFLQELMAQRTQAHKDSAALSG